MDTKKFGVLFVFILFLQCNLTGCGSGDSGGGAGAPPPQTGSPTTERQLPSVVEAVALSEHYVLVAFAEPVDAMALDTDLYVIATTDGTHLTILEARPGEQNNSVLLATQTQEPVSYQLRTVGVDGSGGDAVFEGSSTVEPDLLSAIALSNTEVLLTFNERLDQTSADNELFYRISFPDLDVITSTLQVGIAPMTVLLNTEPQENIRYTVKVTNVRREQGGQLIDPINNLADFFGIPPNDTARPRLESAESTGETTVVLRFSEPFDAPDVLGAARADDPINFTIDPPLAIVAAESNHFHTQITLTTAPQEAGVEYTVTVSEDVHDPAGNSIVDPDDPEPPATVNTATFRFLRRPALETAVALSSTTVLLTFSARLDQESAEDPGFYRIASPDLDISAAMLRDDQSSVLLTTEEQANTQYTVVVTNVRGRLGGEPIDPAHNSATFVGILSDDEPPRLVSAEATSSTMVQLTFNEPLLSTPLDNAAADPMHYTITPPVAVTRATLRASDTQVEIITLPLTAGITYTVMVAEAIMDRAENPISPPDNEADFIFAGQPGVDDDLPRVVGAASTGNTGVIVQFSKPMSDSALVAANYVIVQSNVIPEAGTLLVTADPPPQFTGPDRLTVALTTRSQNQLIYTLTVVNVTDLAGNPLAPMQPGAGTGVDPRSANFPGTPPTCGPNVCTNGHGGLAGSEFCASDDDCTDDGTCDAVDVPVCAGACQAPDCAPADADHDGLSDSEEQRGWTVTVILGNGDTVQHEVTSDPDSPDTDGDGLDDALERAIGIDPRDTDTDNDGLDDSEEWNVAFTSPADQDSDNDGISDTGEVEFYKTNALLADSDGDGYDDGQELFEMHRDPRLADLPRHRIRVENVRLQIDQRFTFTDEDGDVRTETSSTSSVLENERSSSDSRDTGTITNIFGQLETGVDTCQADEACDSSLFAVQFAARFKLLLTAGIGVDIIDTHTTEFATATTSAFESALERGREFSSSSAVTREVVGASLSAEVILENLSDVAFRLSNVEIRVATTDPQDPSRLVPVATLLPDQTLLTGEDVDFTLGPGQRRGPVIFSNNEVFPDLVEDLMRAPRGLVFSVANYQQTTEDERDFAFGLQDVRDRTVAVSFDFGDGEVKEFHAITAGVLNRPRDELRCALHGDHPNQSCLVEPFVSPL